MESETLYIKISVEEVCFCMGLQRVGCDWATGYTHTNWKNNVIMIEVKHLFKNIQKKNPILQKYTWHSIKDTIRVSDFLFYNFIPGFILQNEIWTF